MRSSKRDRQGWGCGCGTLFLALLLLGSIVPKSPVDSTTRVFTEAPPHKSYKGVFVEIGYIDLENSDFNLTLDWYTRGEQEWDSPQEEFPKDFPIDTLKWLGLWRVESNNLFGRSNS
jgi:hypothetical protein